jgi:hypothetical protein
MPLSEHEQRLLEQIEQGLYAEDPKFAASVRRARARRGGSRRRLVLAALGAVVGLGVILVAMATKLIPLGVVGFLIIVGCCSYGLMGLGNRTARGPLGVVGPDGSTSRGKRSDGGIKDRMEGRIRRRFDEE